MIQCTNRVIKKFYLNAFDEIIDEEVYNYKMSFVENKLIAIGSIEIDSRDNAIFGLCPGSLTDKIFSFDIYLDGHPDGFITWSFLSLESASIAHADIEQL